MVAYRFTLMQSPIKHFFSFKGQMSVGKWRMSWIMIVMIASSNGNILRVTGPLCREFTCHRWIPRTKYSDAELWCFFDMRLTIRLSKQSWGWWFETPPRPLLISKIIKNWVRFGWMENGLFLMLSWWEFTPHVLFLGALCKSVSVSRQWDLALAS